MTTPRTHVFALKVGPVQGFIAQSRRTRDLWYGSDLLSKLSRAMARELQRSGARLIFPHPDQLEEPRGDETARGVPNKVLALVDGDPEPLVPSVRREARGVLIKEWLRVRRRCEDLLLPDADRWAQEQLDTFLELHVAWAPPGEGGYAQALEEAETALEARRALHEFVPWRQQPPAGTPKSSLDGGRPSVLRRDSREGGTWKGLRIGLREELDALGLLKRAGGEPDQFVPVPSIGLAAWLDTARQKHPEVLSRLTSACARHGFTRVRRTELPWVAAYPFDGQLLLPERWKPYFEEYRDRATAPAEAAIFGAEAVMPLRRALGVEPHPYVACLVADGDRMGETLRKLAASGGWEAHQKVSHALAGFTVEARTIVQEKYRGVLVYAGGDDVLAFVCPPDAPACARALARAFERAVKTALVGTELPPPTLSVGLGIGHVLESLGTLLDLGRRAEKLAKKAGRNALALLVAKHAGRERVWASQWTSDPLARLKHDMELLSSGRLPLAKVHEVEQMARRFPAKASDESSAAQAQVLVCEVERILSRAEAGRQPIPLSLEEVGLADLPRIDGTKLHQCLREWSARLLVAELLERSSRNLVLREDGDT